MRPLVTGAWLAEHLDDVRVVDVRWYLDGRSGREAYEHGHLPGAVWLDIDTQLSDPATAPDGRHPLPSPQRFADALGAAGIAYGTPVVAYDDAGGSIASRLWWLLHVLGEAVAVLDGGIDAWPGELTTAVPGVSPVPRSPRPWPPDRFVTADQIATGGAHVIDARSGERYAGGDPRLDPRPGHIPGAVSAPWVQNLDDAGRFRSADRLRTRFAEVLGGPVAAYCGSGVTACHDLLALTLIGVDDIALYPGSWSQWGADTSRGAEVGSSARRPGVAVDEP